MIYFDLGEEVHIYFEKLQTNTKLMGSTGFILNKFY